MAISCGYCGAAHDTVADVRSCAGGRQAAADTASPAGSPIPPGADGLPAAQVGPGPDALARGAIVAPGSAAPAGWTGIERVRLDADTLADRREVDWLTTRFRDAHRERRRMVIEAPADLGWVDPPVAAPPYELGPRFGFLVDELRYLATSNAVDFRRYPEGRWELAERAVALGATATGPGDVVLADGTPVWLDGGPIGVRARVDGVAVLHAVAVEHADPVRAGLRAPLDDAATESSAELASDQRAAVVHDGGAARIIAPAGSGKTRVLTERARHLLTAWRLPASAVTLVAFNKRAQEEMRKRTADLPGIEVRTLNSIGLAVLNGAAPFARRPHHWRTADEPEVRKILGDLVKFPRRRNTDPVAPWIEALGQVRLGLRSPEVVEAAYDGDIAGFADVYPKFREALRRAGAVDFDEQIHSAIELLIADEGARRSAQRACRMLLVDEFQDLAPAHLLLVRLLAAPSGAVFGVGDDDQTIYGYNGADPGWLIDFAELFPTAGDHPLVVNYRCPAPIVAAADNLLRHNRRRVPKTIRADRAEPGTEEGYEILDSEDTLAATIGAVERGVAGGAAPGEIAVLTRVNALLAPVQAGLLGAGLPVSGGVGGEFMDRTAIRAALAWLRLAAGSVADSGRPFAADDLFEVLRRPSRSLHPRIGEWIAEQTDLDGLRRLAARLNEDRDRVKVDALADDIALLGRMIASGSTTTEVMATLIDEIGLGGAVATLDDHRRGMNRSAQGDDLTALGQLASLQPTVDRFEHWLRDLLHERRSPDGVVLATVHRVKGQEWPIVVVHHADADSFPHRLAEDVEEERRLFHVALTRARTRCVVVAGARPSPFVAELTSPPPDHEAQRPGARADRVTRPASTTKRTTTSTDDDPLTDKATVCVAPGVVIVDGGSEWVVQSVDAEGALAVCDRATRRFGPGARIVTTGRQRGALLVAEGLVADAAALAYERLRVWRDRARQGKPAYVVFDDKTLAAIARSGASTAGDLAGVRGVGPAKLEQFGAAVLGILGDGGRSPGEGSLP